MNKAILASNLIAIRHASGQSQDDIARKAGLSRAGYVNLESGKAEPRSETLYNLAKALSVPIEDLLVERHILKHVRFRSTPKLKTREAIVARTARWLERYNELEEILQSKKPCRLPKKHFPSGVAAAERAALEVRRDFGISDNEPILNVGGLLEERIGVKLLLVQIASDDFFGLSVSAQDRGPAIIVNSWERISVERWIFSALHELGHLVLHLGAYSVDKQEEENDQEVEANVFSATFLMPPGMFEKEFKNSTGLPLYDQVLHLKRIFKVSWKTVLMKLKVRDRDIWKKFLHEHRRRHNRPLSSKAEVEPLSHEAFCSVLSSEEPKHLDAADLIETRLKTLVRHGLEEGKISQNYAAELLGLDLLAMRELRQMWAI